MKQVPRLVKSAMVCLLVVMSCSADPDVAEYGPENRDAFMQACSDPQIDSLMIRDVCDCIFRSVRDTYPVSELAGLDERLRLDALATPPAEITEFVAACFVAEADL